MPRRAWTGLAHELDSRDVTEPTLGPLSRVLIATGQLTLPADDVKVHDHTHPVMPPPPRASVEFGTSPAATCTGCYGLDLAGGPTVGGGPSWAPEGI